MTTYTNAATIIGEEFQDTEELDGVFSGLMEYTGAPKWPYNGFTGEYDPGAGSTRAAPRRRRAGRLRRRNPASRPPDPRASRLPPNSAPEARRTDKLVQSLVPPAAERDETLEHPRCVFQIVKRHFARYTPEMVQRATGCRATHF